MHDTKNLVLKMPNPTQRRQKATINLRSNSSLALQLVPGLEDFPGSAAGSQQINKSTDLISFVEAELIKRLRLNIQKVRSIQ
jgi:hypothetical protein